MQNRMPRNLFLSQLIPIGFLVTVSSLLCCLLYKRLRNPTIMAVGSLCPSLLGWALMGLVRKRRNWLNFTKYAMIIFVILNLVAMVKTAVILYWEGTVCYDDEVRSHPSLCNWCDMLIMPIETVLSLCSLWLYWKTKISCRNLLLNDVVSCYG